SRRPERTRWYRCGPLAHLVERTHGMGEVTGSSPVRSTTFDILQPLTMDQNLKRIDDCLKIVLHHYKNIPRDAIVIHLQPFRMTMMMRPFLNFLWTPKTKWRFLLLINSDPKR